MKKIYEEYLEVDVRSINAEELVRMAERECKEQIFANIDGDGCFNVTKEEKENNKVEVRVKLEVEASQYSRQEGR